MSIPSKAAAQLRPSSSTTIVSRCSRPCGSRCHNGTAGGAAGAGLAGRGSVTSVGCFRGILVFVHLGVQARKFESSGCLQIGMASETQTRYETEWSLISVHTPKVRLYHSIHAHTHTHKTVREKGTPPTSMLYIWTEENLIADLTNTRSSTLKVWQVMGKSLFHLDRTSHESHDRLEDNTSRQHA